MIDFVKPEDKTTDVQLFFEAVPMTIRYEENEKTFQEIASVDSGEIVTSQYIQKVEGNIHYPINGHIGESFREGIKTKIIKPEKGGKLYMSLEGSLHSFHNQSIGNGWHNYNRFYYGQLSKTIMDLNSKFNISLESNLRVMEMGFNIKTKVDPDIILNEIQLHKEMPHSVRVDKSGYSFKQFERSSYYIKAYNKSKQFGLPDNILRIEVKFKRKTEFNKVGIECIGDLLEKDNLRALFDFCMSRFSELRIIDQRNQNECSKEDNLIIQNYVSHSYWLERRKGKNKVSGAAIKKEVARMEKVINKNGLFSTKNWLMDAIETEFNELLGVNVLHSPFEQIGEQPRLTNSTHHISVNSLPGPSQRLCIVTQVDITMQKDDSEFLSPITIEKLEKDNPDLFKMIVDQFESKEDTKPRVNNESQYYYLAHNIRNKHFNKKANKRAKVRRLECKISMTRMNYSNTLFPLTIEEENKFRKSRQAKQAQAF